VTTRTIDLAASRTLEQEETWLPVLFRGGVSWGEAHNLKAYGLVQGNRIVGGNLCGGAVVEAVALENRRPKGPRILLSDAFVSQVKGDAKVYVGEAPGVLGVRELLWPMTVLKTAGSLQDAFKSELGMMIRGIANLLVSNPADSEVAEHYVAFLGLTVRAALAKYVGQQEDLKEEVAKILLACADSGPVADRILDQTFPRQSGTA
jgi:hypothetical protein